MEIFAQHHEIAAAFMARVFLGLLFYFQGHDAVFGIGLKQVMQTYREGFQEKNIPRSLVDFSALFTSLSALAGGFLLIVGLFEIPALYLLGLNLLIAATGFGIRNPLWDMRFVYPRLVLLLFLLVIPNEWNRWSIDFILHDRWPF